MDIRIQLAATAATLTILAGLPFAGVADTLDQARVCAGIRDDVRRWACFDRVFPAPGLQAPGLQQLPQEHTPLPQEHAPRPAEVTRAPPVAEPSPAAVAKAGAHQSDPAAAPEVDAAPGRLALLRPWDRSEQREIRDTIRIATIVSTRALPRSRWLIRLDTNELFESNESDDFVPQVGQAVEIKPSRFSAGFTIHTDTGATRMKRLACDGSSRRREVARKCELLLDDV